MQSKRVTLLLLLLLICVLVLVAMAEESISSATTPTPEGAVHIIYTEKPEYEDADIFHVRTLASVLGSEDAAKKAMLYSYKHAASGFSAKLTPAQVEEISKQPGVLQVVPSRTMQLHAGPGRMNV